MSKSFLKNRIIISVFLVALMGFLFIMSKSNFVVCDFRYTSKKSDIYNRNYDHLQGIPDAPFLMPIVALPDFSGRLYLEWTDVLGATTYKLYRETTNITEISGLTPIETTDQLSYTDLPPEDGTYYYAVTALNSTGESDISNVRSKNVILPSSTIGVGFNIFITISIFGISIIIAIKKIRKEN
ncbi:MAG: hypothetical protein FK730_13895 [Asgard group archaeon]|nr:hypothetical protein [Asgard group archaeon]